ncbi:MAG: hypothetical protein HKN25_15860, partial [Pyrinomonadaceae bacterium]|nr:hypothetical protein [Pyrinomonadaceae bacterium]
MSPEMKEQEHFVKKCEKTIRQLYAECVENAPNLGVQFECFCASLSKSLKKYLLAGRNDVPTKEEADKFLASIKKDDLFLALGCANGNERAWWEFDQHHRA